MNYSDLTKTQKRCIDAFVSIRPELASQETITRPEIEELFKTLFDARATGGEKIGYPMWLVKGEKTGRGVYKFPAPSLSATKTSKSKSKSKTVQPAVKVEEEDKEFFTDLKEYGIMETA
jgi:hypothetical protein